MALALFGAALTHAWHATHTPGQRRWWHLGHIVMAAGMATMYLLPRIQHPQLYTLGLVLFGLLTAVHVVVVVRLRRRETTISPLWMVFTVDHLAMTYMLLEPAIRPTWLTVVVVLFLAGETLAWLARGFDRLAVFTHPSMAPADAAPEAAARHRTGPQLLSARPARDGAATDRSSVSVAHTLAVMTASMAYMLAVM